MESLLKANEVAKILGISRSMVFALWSRGELPAVRIGKSIRCRPSDLAAFIDANTVSTNKNLPAVDAASKSTLGTPVDKSGDRHE